MNRDANTEIDIISGNKPSLLVRQYYAMAQAGMGLDLRCGVGADCLFLAKHDFQMIGLDSNPDQIEKALRNASRKDIAIDYQTLDIRAFKFHKDRYNIILVNHLFQNYRNSEISELCNKIHYSLKKNGLLIGSGLTVDDPSCRALRKKKIPQVEKNSFQITPQTVRSFFEPREILEYFPTARVVYYAENEYFESGHNKPGWHGLTEFVFRKI